MHQPYPMSNPDALPIWMELKSLKINNSFETCMTSKYFDVTINHQHLNQEVFNRLAQLSDLQGLELAKNNWLSGVFSENMPQYLFLRAFKPAKILSHHPFQFEQVSLAREKIKIFSNTIRNAQWLGYSGKAITDVVNIGMGGSDLGPRLCNEALGSFQSSSIRCHFISDADYFSFEKTLKTLNPETTLFIISSKSFTTEETLLNAKLALEWINHPDALNKHFIAITAFPERATQHGFIHILEIWDWVIGRYSCCSAINLITSIMIGYDYFEQFLKGAHFIDEHFLNEKCTSNLPIIMALIGLWNINFLNIHNHLLLIYNSKLRLFVDYIQQVDMESNGKSVNIHGEKINYATGPIIWGGLGNQAQHSFYQHLAQSQHQTAIDFISVNDSHNHFINQLCFARKKVLHCGFESPEGPKYSIQRQKAINHISIHEITPESLGALIALYEHKVFTQAWLWNINPFDQPGVESAKKEVHPHRQNNFAKGLETLCFQKD